MGIFDSLKNDLSSIYSKASSEVSNLYTGVMTSTIATTTESDMTKVGSLIGKTAMYGAAITGALGLEPIAAALGTASGLGYAMEGAGSELASLSASAAATKKVKVNSLLS